MPSARYNGGAFSESCSEGAIFLLEDQIKKPRRKRGFLFFSRPKLLRWAIKEGIANSFYSEDLGPTRSIIWKSELFSLRQR